MGDVGGLQVHGIWSCGLVHKKVVEALSNYKRSYFWWFGNLACGDLNESNRTEKDQGRVYLLGLFEGRGRMGCVIQCVWIAFR